MRSGPVWSDLRVSPSRRAVLLGLATVILGPPVGGLLFVLTMALASSISQGISLEIFANLLSAVVLGVMMAPLSYFIGGPAEIAEDRPLVVETKLQERFQVAV